MEEEEGAVYLDDKRKKEEKEDLGVKKKKKDALKVFFEKATNSSPIRALNSALASRISGGQFALYFNSAAVVVTQSKALKSSGVAALMQILHCKGTFGVIQ